MCTVADLQKRASRTPAARMRFQLLLWTFTKPSYEEWCDLVEEAVGLQTTELAKRRNTLQGVSEDGLTTIIVLGLKGLGLSAGSAMMNGNCDLVVEFDDYTWLAEAKIDTGVTKVWGGYLQLTQRYSTGIPNQLRGGMILYCYRDAAAALLAEWRAALEEERPDCRARTGSSELTFRSNDLVEVTGLCVGIVHYAVALRHAPVEKSERLSKESLAAARAAKTRASRG